MDGNGQHAREVRAARNQSLFRLVNERMRELNEAFSAVADTFAIACECADTMCIATLEIARDAYLGVRKEPRRFLVAAGHIYPDVEIVVSEHDSYVVVEKLGAAGVLAEELGMDAPRS
jgi:hypothetical protein